MMALVCAAQADIISLLSYVSMSLEDPEDNPLPEGSVVLIFGSADAVNDGMTQVGNSFVADSVQNDDVLLGMAIVGQPYYSGGGGDILGTILSDMQIAWDDTEVVVNHLYIRFFDSTNVPEFVSSWGESHLTRADENFNLVEADFDVATNGVLGDRVWDDLDGDGQQDAGEDGVAGVQVVLYRDGMAVATNVTDALGQYRFERLIAGDYQLAFVHGTYPAGYSATLRGPTGSSDPDDSDPDPATDLTETIALGESEQDLSWDLGLARPPSIGDKVWFDFDLDGQQGGPGENGAENVRVFLLDAGENIIATNLTDANGLYLFENLAPGTYRVQFDLTSLPPRHHPTIKTGNLLDAGNSDADPLTGLTEAITLTAGMQVREVDFGIWASGEIGDRVWYDNDGDGLQDLG
ncbi:MAG TPA: SdrD B-like domain-containing protein, partial [Kiritimatiellia bacterium]|nr:SdrD B-like domain-containing protein [Kiritimatiellia bacterium]